MITLNIDKQDCKNLAEMVELYLPQALHDFYEAGALDNIGYLRGMIHTFDELTRAAGGGE